MLSASASERVWCASRRAWKIADRQRATTKMIDSISLVERLLWIGDIHLSPDVNAIALDLAMQITPFQLNQFSSTGNIPVVFLKLVNNELPLKILSGVPQRRPGKCVFEWRERHCPCYRFT